MTIEQAKFKQETGKQPRKWNIDKIPITLTSEEEKEIEKIKLLISDQKILYFPANSELVILQTDTSDNFWVGILLAQKKDIIAYTSRKFSKIQQKYSTYDKELLAIKLALKSLRIYLLNRNFIVETDNKSVAQFLKKKIINNPEENL